MVITNFTYLSTFLPTYLPKYLYVYVYMCVSNIQLRCYVATYDCATYYNLRPSKMNNHNGWWISISFLKSPKNPHSDTLNFDEWIKMTSTWHYGCSHRGVA
jgi:hypothetical protein